MKVLRKIYYPEIPDDGHGRVFFYDNLRFLLIFLVVTRHFLFRVHGDYSVITGLYIELLVFLMPMFVFITGFYSKSIFTKMGDFRVGRIVYFIILYFFLSFAIFLTNTLIRGGGVVWTPFYMVDAAWYLWACAVWFALIPVFRRTPPVPTVIVSIIISLAAGYFDQITYVLSVSKIITFLPFFLLGYYMTRDHMDVALNLKAVWRIAALIIVVILAVVVIRYSAEVNFLFRRVVEGKDSYSVAWSDGRGIAALGALWRLMWYMAFAAMSLCVILLVPRCKMAITPFGGRTLQIYIWHSIIVRVIVPLGFFRLLDSFPLWAGQILMVIAALDLTLLLSFKFLGVPFGSLEKLTRKLEIRPRS